MGIVDDSGSMLNPALPAQMRRLGGPVRTRWDELKETIGGIIEIANCFSEEGIDLHFLNRESLLKVKHAADPSFVQAFEKPPRGLTPLTETLERVANQISTDRGVLLFIFTDGEPNRGPDRFKESLRRLISQMNIRVQIM